jgi:hypothetical protein
MTSSRTTTSIYIAARFRVKVDLEAISPQPTLSPPSTYLPTLVLAVLSRLTCLKISLPIIQLVGH